MTTAEETAPYSGRTAWARNLQTPLREFVETEIGGAAVLLVAAAAALVWINIDAHSYDSFWSTILSIDVGDSWHRARPAAVGQQRPDDVLLLRRRARGAPRVRSRRAARAAPVRPAAARRARRHRGADRDLPELQRGRVDGARVGGRDVDRHGVRPRAARARRAALPGPAARLHADDRRRRRHRRARRDRGVLLRGHRASGVARRDRDLLGPPGRSRRRDSQRHPVSRRRHRRVGRCPEVGRRSDRRRARLRAHHVRLPVVAVGARARHRALPRLPRAADAASWRGSRSRGSAPPSPRTSACSRSSTRGRAT